MFSGPGGKNAASHTVNAALSGFPSLLFPPGCTLGEYDICESCRTGPQCGALFSTSFIFFSLPVVEEEFEFAGKCEEDLNKQLQQTGAGICPDEEMKATQKK